jgi:protein involved in polysaccharide export with SLBB domain
LVSNAEMLEFIRQSGYSRAQMKASLEQLDVAGSLVDPYFDAIEKGRQVPRGMARPELVGALRRLGIMPDETRVSRILPGDTSRVKGPESDDTLANGLRIFGRSLFLSASSQFLPVSAGPTDPDYRLGSGDELVLALAGDVNDVYRLIVAADGYIMVPSVGAIRAAGRTMRELDDALYTRLREAHQGGQAGEAGTEFHVSLGQAQPIQVYIIGEVERPGAYQLGIGATVFSALYRARGPTRNGSFRNIEVRRGGRLIRTIDLYDYLVRGDNRGDLRLAQGDVIFIPVTGPQVGIKGAVRRPAVFEMKSGEGLSELLANAGGVQADALTSRIQIDRILPPAQRRPGVTRVLLDVDLERFLSGTPETVAVRDGDLVQVFTVSAERRHRLTITGAVRQPGVYEWSPGMGLWDLIDRAGGREEEAFTARAHVFRLNETDGTRRMIRVPLLTDATGGRSVDLALADRDSIVVYSQADLHNPGLVTIDGYVKNPGTYPMVEGMTLRDLILAAGGFVRGADAEEVDVARLPQGSARTDTTARTVRIRLAGDNSQEPLNPVAFDPAGAGAAGLGAPPASWIPSASEFQLEHGDHVFVRKEPGYSPLRSVRVTGEVTTPGVYVLESRQERLTTVLERAGGLTKEASGAGLQVIRGGQPIATDFTRAVAEPESRFNLVLETGDSINIPQQDPTVLVSGAVGFESRILYVRGRGLDYYINRAGGFGQFADKDRVSVTYQNGERATNRRSFALFHSTPPIQPGSTIFVPEEPQDQRGGVNWDSVFTRALTIVSTMLTLLIAAKQL